MTPPHGPRLRLFPVTLSLLPDKSSHTQHDRPIVRTLPWILPPLTGLLSTLLIARPYITFDGFLYIESAVALFGDNPVAAYHWIREPGYPALIGIASALPGPLMRNLTAIQGALAGLTAALLAFAVFPRHHRIERLISACLVTVSPYALGYAAGVLQTTAIAFFIALYVAVVSATWRGIFRPPIVAIAVALVILSAAAYLGFQVAYAGGWCLLGVVTGIGYRKARRSKYPRLLLAGSGLAALVALAIAVPLTQLVLTPWQTAKDAGVREAPDRYGLSTEYAGSSTATANRVIDSPLETAADVTRNAVSLIKPATATSENLLFADVSLGAGPPCQFFFYAESIAPSFEIATQALGDYCAPMRGLSAYQAAAGYVRQALPYLGPIAILTVGWFAVRRRYARFFAGLVPVGAMLMYAVAGLGIDRYAYPLVAYGSVALCFWVALTTRWLIGTPSRDYQRWG